MDHKSRNGKRAQRLYFWVYNAVSLPLIGGSVAAVVALCYGAPGPKSGGPMLALFAFYLVATLTASWVARTACGACGLDCGGRSERLLSPMDPNLEVPDPPQARHSVLSTKQRRAISWLIFPILALFGGAAVLGWRQGDWLLAVLGTVGVPIWLWIGRAAWAGRTHDDLEVDGRGLWDTWKARVVPWQRVKSGRVREEWSVGGDLSSQQLRLEDGSGRCVWSADVKNLPPDVRENLFAWVRARARVG